MYKLSFDLKGTAISILNSSCSSYYNLNFEGIGKTFILYLFISLNKCVCFCFCGFVLHCGSEAFGYRFAFIHYK